MRKQMTGFFACLFFASLLLLPLYADANLLLETSASSSRALTLELSGGMLKTNRERGSRRDQALFWSTGLAISVRYHNYFVRTRIDFQRLHLEVNEEGRVDYARMASAIGNASIGGAAGVVMPSAWLPTRVVQFGALVESQTTLREYRLKLRELSVTYAGQRRNLMNASELNEAIDAGYPTIPAYMREAVATALREEIQNLRIRYRIWILTAIGFITVRFDAIGSRASLSRNVNLWGIPIFKPFANSALSLGAGWLHLNLRVKTRADGTIASFIGDRQSETIIRNRPFALMRFALPFGEHFGLQLNGAAGRYNGALIGTTNCSVLYRF